MFSLKFIRWCFLFSLMIALIVLSHIPLSSANQSQTSPPIVSVSDRLNTLALSAAPGTVRGAYFTEWGVYGRKYAMDKVPFDQITHLLYAFLPICGPNESLKEKPEVYAALQRECAGKKDFEITIHDTWAALNPPNDTYKKMEAAKAAHPHLKILASVGGWSLSDPFFAMASNPANRRVFIDSVLRHLDTYKFFDGIDIDWEYPGGGGLNKNLGSPNDKANHLALMKELRVALDSKGRGYLLTSAVGAGPKMIDAVDYKGLFSGDRPVLDLIFAMSYDFYGAWNGERGHMAGVYPGADLVKGFSTQESIDNLIQAGVPANRLAVGVAAYGRAWENVDAKHPSGLSKDASDTSGAALSATPKMWDPGVIDFKVIEGDYAKDGAFTYRYDQNAQGPFLYSADKKTLITYENKCSAQAKIDFSKDRGLAGSFMWSIDSDNGDLLAVMNGQKPSSEDCPCAKGVIPSPGAKPGVLNPNPELGNNSCFASFRKKANDEGNPDEDSKDLPHKDPPPFNDRRLDQVSFLTAHNAFSNNEDGSVYMVRNQTWSIPKQLKNSVRGLMIDVYTSKDGEAIVCHGICGLAGSFPWVSLTDILKKVETFMYEDGEAIVTFHVEMGKEPKDLPSTPAGVATGKSIRASFDAFPGLKSWIFDPYKADVQKNGWPTVGEMIKSGKRLLVFTQVEHPELKEIGIAWDQTFTVENDWSMGTIGDPTPDRSCYSRWGEPGEPPRRWGKDGRKLERKDGKFRKLFVMNHFRDTPEIINSDRDNRNGSLWKRVDDECLKAARRVPNYIALDYVDQGSGREAVIDLNEKARGIAYEEKDYNGTPTLIMQGKGLNDGGSFKSRDNSISSIEVFFDGTRLRLYDGEKFTNRLRDITRSRADLKEDARKTSSIEAF